MQYDVWYMKPDFFRDGTMGVEWLRERKRMPTIQSMPKSHVYLKRVEANSLEDVFLKMQGENWSPNGEARPLIRERGLEHTSMSVGDIVLAAGQPHGWITDRFGFVKLSDGGVNG